MIKFEERYPGASGITGEFLNQDDPRPCRCRVRFTTSPQGLQHC